MTSTHRSVFELRGTPDPMRVVALLAAGAILVVFALVGSRRSDRRAMVAECLQDYSLSRSDEDSARVDAEVPAADLSHLTSCGQLRQAGALH